jgi:hypothetical protein
MMQFSGEIPPSTVIVGGALWTVLFGLLVWLLVSVNQQSIDIKEIATQQNSNARETSKDLARMGNNIDRIEDHNRDQDKRITVLERERR